MTKSADELLYAAALIMIESLNKEREMERACELAGWLQDYFNWRQHMGKVESDRREAILDWMKEDDEAPSPKTGENDAI